MSELRSFDFWEGVLAGGFRLGLPVGVAASGELLGERSGTLNLGLEGTMALGAFSGVVGSAAVGRTFGLLAGLACGAVVGTLFAFLVLIRRADQVVVGFAMSLGGVGLATFLYRTAYDSPPSIDPFGVWAVPGIERIPVLGPVLFRQPVIVWAFPVIVVVMAWALARTRTGLELRAAGDAPEAATARGVRVTRVRVRTTIIAGALGGLGGALLSAGIVGEFSEQIIGGRGFLALALVIAARWRPLLLLPAVWGVGALQAFQLRVQTVGGLGLPVELLRALPYLVTLAVLAIGASGSRSTLRFGGAGTAAGSGP